MDLSSISQELPRRATRRQQLEALNNHTTSEFKAAAKAVTKLFKLSGARTELARTEGYLQAIEDLLMAIQRHDSPDHFDVLSWALEKRESVWEEDGSDSDKDKDKEPEESDRSPGKDLHSDSARFTFVSHADEFEALAGSLKRRAMDGPVDKRIRFMDE